VKPNGKALIVVEPQGALDSRRQDPLSSTEMVTRQYTIAVGRRLGGLWMAEGCALIVNADDFGISPGVNRGVIEAHQRGLVRSASLMSNQPWAAEAVAFWRACPSLGLGLHLTLTAGAPLTPAARVPSLVGPDGRFPVLGVWLARAQLGRLRPEDLRRELSAQIERALTLGAQLDHLDSHHHIHTQPLVGRITLLLAREYGIPAVRCPVERPRRRATRDLLRALLVSARACWLRQAIRAAGLRTTDHFAGLGLGYGFDQRALARQLADLEPGWTELMTHPGYPDAALAEATRYVDGRERELASLTDPHPRLVLERRGIRLASWRQRATTAVGS